MELTEGRPTQALQRMTSQAEIYTRMESLSKEMSVLRIQQHQLEIEERVGNCMVQVLKTIEDLRAGLEGR